MSLPINLRKAHSGDMAFIYSSWLRSFKRSRDKNIDIVTYFNGQSDVIDNLLYGIYTQAIVATSQEDPDTILGWCVKTNDILHYVYVKEAFRRMGIAKLLVGEFMQHTHLTPYGLKALGKRTSTYNPYLATSA